MFSPAFLLVPVGVAALLRSATPRPAKLLFLSWLAAAGATVAVYAKWHDWTGGYCYGPRFLLETTVVLSVLFALARARLTLPWRRAADGLLTVSVLVQLCGVAGNADYTAWHRRHAGRGYFDIHDSQIIAHARAALGLTGRDTGPPAATMTSPTRAAAGPSEERPAWPR